MMPTDININLLQNAVPFSIWKLPDKEVNALPWFGTIIETENLQKNSKIKRSRTVFTVQQIEVLERMFQISAYPSASFRENIKKFTNLSDTRIQVWFKNRRAKHRKKMRNIKPINSTEEFQSRNQSTGLVMTTWRPAFFEDISLFSRTSVSSDSRLSKEAKSEISSMHHFYPNNFTDINFVPMNQKALQQSIQYSQNLCFSSNIRPNVYQSVK